MDSRGSCLSPSRGSPAAATTLRPSATRAFQPREGRHTRGRGLLPPLTGRRRWILLLPWADAHGYLTAAAARASNAISWTTPAHPRAEPATRHPHEESVPPGKKSTVSSAEGRRVRSCCGGLSSSSEPSRQQIEQLPGMLDQVSGTGHLQLVARAESPENSHGQHASIARRVHVD